jgi:hypothetical protein
MKTQYTKYGLFAGLLAMMVLQGCQDDDREIGDPWSHIEGITATTWVLTDAEIIDEGNPSRPRRSISRFFTGGDDVMTLSFTEDGNFVSVPGDGGEVFPLDGTWAFDLNEAPRRVILTSVDGTITANLGAPVRLVDQELQLEIVKRTCVVDGEVKPALGYSFIFARQD